MNSVRMHPLDEHNRTLEANVHPSDWTIPQPTGRYNLVVIGAGTAGLVTAAGAATLGAKVALIARDLMGGDCLNVGCVPSKALISAARAAAGVRRAGQFGVDVAEQGLDGPVVEGGDVLEDEQSPAHLDGQVLVVLGEGFEHLALGAPVGAVEQCDQGVDAADAELALEGVGTDPLPQALLDRVDQVG